MSTLELYILQKLVVVTIFQETNVAGNQEPSNVMITTHEVHIKMIMHKLSPTTVEDDHIS